MADPGGLRRQRADLREVEQPLGVRLGVAHPAAQLRQPGADQDDRQPALRGAVQRGDQRGKLVLLDVLQLVDEHHQRGARLPGSRARRLEQGLEVVLEVAVVGQAGLGLEVDADLDVLIRTLSARANPASASQRPGRQVLGLLDSRQPQQGRRELRRQHRRQRPALGRLDPEGVQAGRLRVVAHPVQQDRLAYPAKTDQEDAFRGQPAPDPLERDRARSRSSSSRPASSGGGVPAPGAKGLLRGSMAGNLERV